MNNLLILMKIEQEGNFTINQRRNSFKKIKPNDQKKICLTKYISKINKINNFYLFIYFKSFNYSNY